MISVLQNLLIGCSALTDIKADSGLVLRVCSLRLLIPCMNLYNFLAAFLS